MIVTTVNIVLTICGALYFTKYWDQYRKILRLQTSKGVSRTYFLKSVLYEFVCTIGALILQNWILLVLSVLPLIGNIVVGLMALKYAPTSHKKTWKHKMYRYLRRLLK